MAALSSHSMCSIQTDVGKDYICIYGGQNAQGELNNLLKLYPITWSDSILSLREGLEVNNKSSPRKGALLEQIGKFNIVIFGGCQ